MRIPMRKQDLILNLLLLLSLVGLSWKLTNDWRKYAIENGPQKLDVHPLSGISIPPSAPAPDYIAITRQNPFSADRNDNLDQPAALAKTLGPPPLIYGSFILGDQRFALMSTEQAAKPERVPEGGTFEGYRLVKVNPESVVLESAAGRDEIMLYNALMRLRRVQARTASSTPPRPATSTQVASTGSGNSTTSPVDTTSQDTANSAAQLNGDKKPSIAVPAGKEVVDTPFGQVVVEKKKP